MQTHRKLDLSEKVGFLSRPEAFPDRPDSVQALETHFAWVFLSDRFAYKLKKPVRTPECDLTTAESRRINCELEIALNRRLAADTYIGVVPLGRTAGRLRLECDRHPVDWLVKMRRLPAEVTLARLLPEMARNDPRLELLLATLCDFYSRTSQASWTEDEYLRRLVQQCNAAADRLLLPALETRDAVIRRVAQGQRAFIDHNREQLAGRVRQGRIRDVHGDLRPEHVFLTEHPQIIDCLEFSADLRQLDTAEELGFLALECEHLGRADIGQRLAGQYVGACGDAVPPGLFDFYLSRRAQTRAWTSIWHLEEWLGESRAQHWTDQAVWYIDRAARAIEQANTEPGPASRYKRVSPAATAATTVPLASTTNGTSP